MPSPLDVPLLVLVEHVNLHWSLSVSQCATWELGQRPCWSRWKGVEAKALLESLEGGPRQRPCWSHWKGVRGKGPAGVTGKGFWGRLEPEARGHPGAEGSPASLLLLAVHLVDLVDHMHIVVLCCP